MNPRCAELAPVVNRVVVCAASPAAGHAVTRAAASQVVAWTCAVEQDAAAAVVATAAAEAVAIAAAEAVAIVAVHADSGRIALIRSPQCVVSSIRSDRVCSIAVQVDAIPDAAGSTAMNGSAVHRHAAIRATPVATLLVMVAVDAVSRLVEEVVAVGDAHPAALV